MSHRDFQELTHPAAAEFLTDPRHYPVLNAFIDTERSTGELADHLGISANAAYKLIQKLERLGFIEVARQQPRGGKAIKYYRATAPRFFVPAKLLPIERILEIRQDRFWKRIVKALERVYAQERLLERGYGVLLDRLPSGELGLRISAPDGGFWDLNRQPRSAAVTGWVDLRLDYDTAKQLQNELAALMTRYSHLQGTGNYLLGLHLVEQNPNEFS